MLEKLKKSVYEANMELMQRGLVIYTWGNVSGIDREKKLVVIKPSGVEYAELSPENMVVVSLLTGEVVEGKYKPSSDTPTHLVLYQNFEEIQGVVHTHSVWATSFAQAGLSIPAFGTTHADYFYGDVPCTRDLKSNEVDTDYEENTGKVIVETMRELKPLELPGVLVKQHGPFTWGNSPQDAVYHAVVLDKIAEMAYKTMTLNPGVGKIKKHLLEKHYQRKHGKNAYYGQ